MPDMAPLKAAERLETIDHLVLIKGIGPEYDAMRNAVNYAASLCRKIATGEYKQVVHARWEWVDISPIKKELHCSNCGFHGFRTPYCPTCGALMGKDDSHV